MGDGMANWGADAHWAGDRDAAKSWWMRYALVWAGGAWGTWGRSPRNQTFLVLEFYSHKPLRPAMRALVATTHRAPKRALQVADSGGPSPEDADSESGTGTADPGETVWNSSVIASSRSRRVLIRFRRSTPLTGIGKWPAWSRRLTHCSRHRRAPCRQTILTGSRGRSGFSKAFEGDRIPNGSGRDRLPARDDRAAGAAVHLRGEVLVQLQGGGGDHRRR